MTSSHNSPRRVFKKAGTVRCAFDFSVGDRFKLSELGSVRCPRLATKVGTVRPNWGEAIDYERSVSLMRLHT